MASHSESILKLFSAAFVLIVLVMLSGKLFAEQKKLLIGVADGKPHHRDFKVAERLFQEISLRIQVPFTLLPLPSERATWEFKKGLIDAEAGRIAKYIEKVSGAIRVTEPIVSVPLYAYSLDSEIQINGWTSLAGYRLVTVRGSYVNKVYLLDYHPYLIGSLEQAFGFLQADRADILISSPVFADPILNSLAFKGHKIKRLEPPLEILGLYTFFLAKHSLIAEKFQQALVDMKKEGVYHKIFSETK